MKRTFILILTLLVVLNPLPGQDGEILSRERIDLLKRAELTNIIFDYKDGDWYIKPDLAYLKEVVAEKIIYSSDGLNITGYLVYPIDSVSCPVIIYNRGGNREFGSLNSAKIALILHGTSDWRVVPGMAIDLSEKLLQLHIPFRLVLFEGADHGILEYRDEVDQMVVEWFDRYVKNKEPLPNLTPHGR